MTVVDLFVTCLEEEGVEYIFGLPGEENEDLLFALDESSIEFVPCRHEQGAAFMANVWGRLTGDTGVCLSTLGPGATNLITGVADANLDKAPVLAITAQGGLTRLHHESHQRLDIVNMFRPITKWNTAVSSPEIVSEVIRKAFKIAEFEKPGATHVELSEDLAREPVSEGDRPLHPKEVRRPNPDAQAIQQTADLLREADHPLIIAGNGALRKGANVALYRLVEKHEIPVVSTFMGKGAISDTKPHSLMSIGLGFRDYVMDAVDQADLVLTVGYDIAEYAPEMWNPRDDHTIVHIDFSPAEIYTHYDPEIEIVSDVAAALRELDWALDDANLAVDAGWYAPVRERILNDLDEYTLEEGDDFTTPGALNIIRDAMDEDGLLISDVGTHKMWIARNFKTCCPNGCIISNGLASMGIALPGAIAAALVDPDRQIVAAMGDGGFMMNAQELETAKRLGVGFTAIVFNDNDYGLITWKQEQSRGRSVSTKITNPDFRSFAESFAIRGYRPETVGELEEQIREAVTSQELSVVEVPVSTHVNRELTHKLSAHADSL